MKEQIVPVEFLEACLSYNRETGELRWRETRPASHFRTARGSAIWHKLFPGQIAGKPDGQGYLAFETTYEGKRIRLQAHRVAWALTTGSWPEDIIDHKNRIKGDNRFANLREATTRQNAQNMSRRANTRTGVKGVHMLRNGRFRAQIRVDGKPNRIGVFTSLDEAAAAYRAAAVKYFGEFASAG